METKTSSNLSLQDFLASDLAKIFLTLFLLITLFAVTFFLSFVSIKRAERAAGVNLTPEAQVKLPDSEGNEPVTKAECEQKEGVWQKWGLTQLEYCQIPASDAGKACTDGDECELGKCISEDGNIPGKCQEFKNTFGCFSYVEEGKIDAALCID